MSYIGSLFVVIIFIIFIRRVARAIFPPSKRIIRPSFSTTSKQPIACNDPFPVDSSKKQSSYPPGPILATDKEISRSQLVEHIKQFMSWYYQFDVTDLEENDKLIEKIEELYIARYSYIPPNGNALGGDKELSIFALVGDIEDSMGVEFGSDEDLLNYIYDSLETFGDLVKLFADALHDEGLLSSI